MVFQDVGFDARLPTVDKQIASYPTSPGKAIIQIKALSALNRLVILNSEGVLSVHDMWHLEVRIQCKRSNPLPPLSQIDSILLCIYKTSFRFSLIYTTYCLDIYLCISKSTNYSLCHFNVKQ